MKEGPSEIIGYLLGMLPDSHHDEECWKWCWDELDEGAQDDVKTIRKIALDWLEEQARPNAVQAHGKEQ